MADIVLIDDEIAGPNRDESAGGKIVEVVERDDSIIETIMNSWIEESDLEPREVLAYYVAVDITVNVYALLLVDDQQFGCLIFRVGYEDCARSFVESRMSKALERFPVFVAVKLKEQLPFSSFLP